MELLKSFDETFEFIFRRLNITVNQHFYHKTVYDLHASWSIWTLKDWHTL